MDQTRLSDSELEVDLQSTAPSVGFRATWCELTRRPPCLFGQLSPSLASSANSLDFAAEADSQTSSIKDDETETKIENRRTIGGKEPGLMMEKAENPDNCPLISRKVIPLCPNYMEDHFGTSPKVSAEQLGDSQTSDNLADLFADSPPSNASEDISLLNVKAEVTRCLPQSHQTCNQQPVISLRQNIKYGDKHQISPDFQSLIFKADGDCDEWISVPSGSNDVSSELLNLAKRLARQRDFTLPMEQRYPKNFIEDMFESIPDEAVMNP
ncbi:unnamed protein product [Protopolystoma xenopodis]|uniref:Uncharacterized protein n=1 Tax=Protopolystoma xenopodis TaxID=117903 RepID=A0A448WMF8_9PLAT|nr:unnamed protein product [Protopolystoma xenopodis]